MPPIDMMMMILKENHHQRDKNSQPTVILWKTRKTTVARQSRERDRKMPIGILRSSAPRTSEQPGTGGGSRIQKPTTKMASRKCRQKKSSPPWKPSLGELQPKSTASSIS